ncbi:MAG: SGNH/GDSL hydrolase family protein, partial [Planctomycetota bacterium]
FNLMLRGLAKAGPFPHVRYVDLRAQLSNGPDYKNSWANELHPTRQGFARVADKFAVVIEE